MDSILKVFIADDSDIFRERLISLLLEIPEVNIAGQARDVSEAMRFIREQKLDMAILDIRMRGGSGIDVLKSIKKYNPSVIVIMLTNYPYPQDRKKCMKEGADYFFEKSKDLEKIIEVIKELILKCEGENSRADLRKS